MGDFREQVLLAGEVVEEGLLRDVHAGTDIGHLGGREALFDEEIRGGADDARPGFQLAPLPASEIRGGVHGGDPRETLHCCAIS